MQNPGKSLVILGLIVVFALAACGQDDNSSETVLEGDNSQFASSSSDADDVASAETNVMDAAGGSIIFVDNETLYEWPAGRTEPESLANDVNGDMVFFSPGDEFMVYGVSEGRNTNIFKHDLTTNDVTQIYDLPPNAIGGSVDWQINNWSPNLEWAVLQSVGFNLLSMQGDGTVIRYSNNFVNADWLTDNRLLIYELDFRAARQNPEQFSFPPVRSLEVLDPETGERIELDMDENANQFASFEDFIVYMEGRGYSLAIPPEPDVSAPRPQVNDPTERFIGPSGQLCWNYTITQPVENGDVEVLYARDDISQIVNLRQLSDGSLVFVQLRYPDCNLDIPVGELFRLVPGQEPQLLSDKIASQFDLNAVSRGFSAEQRIAVSPNGNYVAYVEISREGEPSALMIWSVEGRESIPLTLNGEPIRPSLVYWVNSS